MRTDHRQRRNQVLYSQFPSQEECYKKENLEFFAMGEPRSESGSIRFHNPILPEFFSLIIDEVL